MFFLSLNFISAESSFLGSFVQNKNVSLRQTCDNCTFVNITSVTLPNSTLILMGQNMTKNGVDYNYTFVQTDLLGDYIYNVCGDKDGILNCENIDFIITPTGRILETSDSITYVILTAGSILLFLLCLYGGLVLPFRNRRDEEGIISVDKLKYFKIGLLFLSYVLFVWMLNLLFSLSNNFSILTQYTGFFEIMFRVMNAMSYPIFVFMLILMGALAWKDLQLKKLLERGFNP